MGRLLVRIRPARRAHAAIAAAAVAREVLGVADSTLPKAAFGAAAEAGRIAAGTRAVFAEPEVAEGAVVRRVAEDTPGAAVAEAADAGLADGTFRDLAGLAGERAWVAGMGRPGCRSRSWRRCPEVERKWQG